MSSDSMYIYMCTCMYVLYVWCIVDAAVSFVAFSLASDWFCYCSFFFELLKLCGYVVIYLWRSSRAVIDGIVLCCCKVLSIVVFVILLFILRLRVFVLSLVRYSGGLVLITSRVWVPFPGYYLLQLFTAFM